MLTGPPLRTVASATALVAALSCHLLACTSETGIVVEISQTSLQTQPDTLRLFLGVRLDELSIELPECGQVARFNDETAIADRVVSVADHDLRSDPYRLLLRAGQDLALDRDLMIVVLAFSGDTLVGVGTLDNPVRFVPDKLVSWSLSLHALDESDYRETAFGCHCSLTGSGGMIAITPIDDPDCDGDVGASDCAPDNPHIGTNQPELCFTPEDDNCSGEANEQLDRDQDGYFSCRDDCFDYDEDVYLGAPEKCDGIDNDCIDDNERYPSEVDCYVGDTRDEVCFMGTRTCDDTSGLQDGGWDGECKPLGDALHFEASPSLCDRFDDCNSPTRDYQYAAECADELFETYYCDVRMRWNDQQSRYEACPGGIPLGQELPQLGDDCRWTLMGGVQRDGYSVGLHAALDGNPSPSAVLDACHVDLRISEITANSATEQPYGDVKLWSEWKGQPYHHVRVKLFPEVLSDNDFCLPFGGISCELLPARPSDELP